jgi:hypothetical protein
MAPRARKPKLKFNQMLYRMGKLILEPDDWIVLSIDLDLNHKEVMAIQRLTDKRFKPYRTIILSHGMKLGVLRKGKSHERTSQQAKRVTQRT